jgi:hypothetical protein
LLRQRNAIELAHIHATRLCKVNDEVRARLLAIEAIDGVNAIAWAHRQKDHALT